MTRLKRLNVISTYSNSPDENHGLSENQDLQTGENQDLQTDENQEVQENEYEKLRQLTVRENKKILEEMGIKNIAKSMTSLAQSKKTKKRVVKQNTHTGDNSEKDYQQNPKSVVSKKPPIYISSLSTDRVANIRKIRRVIASKPQSLPPQIAKGNQGGTKRTMALDENDEEDDEIFQVDDIASNPPPPPPQKVPLTSNARNAVSEIVIGNQGGTKKRLALVDENDDDDDEIFQVDDIPSNPLPPPPLKVTSTSNAVDAMSQIVKGNKGGTKRRLALVDENGGDDDVIFQVSDLFMTENEPAIDDTAVEMENESVLGALNKGRGYTHKIDIWKMKKTERICVSFDKFGHPVGEEGRELGQYLGTLVRMAENVSIEYSDWRKVPMQKKEDMYSLVKSKFTFHPVESSQVKKWILFSMGKKWRTWKGLLKSRGYDPSLTIDEIVAKQTNNDDRVNPTQFKELVARWFTPEFQNTCVKKRSSRSKMKEPHVTGTKSFARLAHELAMDNDGMYPTRGEMYIKTRTRKDGSIVDDEALGVVTSLKAIASKSTSTSGVQDDFSNDEYSKVKGPEKRGYVRLVGKMPAKKSNGDSQIIQQLESATQTISQLQGAFNVMVNIIQEHIPNANLSAILSNMNLQVSNIGSANELSSKSTDDGERADKR
ncbi:hypothetical protein SSX86_008895 [Deinandra increscens subsp. villosa]|uniref:Transposase n=1 Tax=Deinandra increscens subsp. villosa TaxID=3103831 RepID=A0AAP0DC70_9ASTR